MRRIYEKHERNKEEECIYIMINGLVICTSATDSTHLNKRGRRGHRVVFVITVCSTKIESHSALRPVVTCRLSHPDE